MTVYCARHLYRNNTKVISSFIIKGYSVCEECYREMLENNIEFNHLNWKKDKSK